MSRCRLPRNFAPSVPGRKGPAVDPARRPAMTRKDKQSRTQYESSPRSQPDPARRRVGMTAVTAAMTAERSSHRVAMFHIGRSGSAVLASMLRQHPRIVWGGEMLSPNYMERPPGLDPATLMRRQIVLPRDRIYGLELKFFHASLLGLSLEEAFGVLLELGFDRFIVLQRRNVLRKIVSSLVAHRTGVWHLARGESAKLVKIKLDPARIEIDRTARPLIDFLEGYERSFAELDALISGREVLRLVYEDDIQDDPAAGYRRICAFLGVDAPVVRARMARTAPHSLRDILLNPSEVEQALAGTRFEWMLHD